MANDNTNTDSGAQLESADSFNIKDLLYLCLSKWYWFVISLVICVGFTYWNLLKTPNVYTRTAQIQIKEFGSAPNMGGEYNLNMFNTYNNLYDEITHMRSRDITAEVVKRLHLDMNYSTKGRFHDNVLYGKSLPINALIENPNPDAYLGFTVEEKGDKLTLTDFSGPGLDEKTAAQKVAAAFGKTVETPVGKVTLMKTDYYTPANREIKVARWGINGAIGAYSGKLHAAVDPSTMSIVNISASDVSPERAEDFINTALAVYNQKWMDDKNKMAISTSKFIEDRLGVIERELGNVDNDISSYKSSNLITDVNATANMYLGQAQEANNAVMQLNTKINMAQHVRSYLTDPSRQYELLPTNTGFEDAGVATGIAAYNQMILKRNNLLANTNEDNPLVEDIDANLQRMRQSIIQSIDNAILGINAQIKTARQMGGEAVSQIATSPQQSKYLLSVERQQKVKESLYLYLLQKREENELSQAFTAYNTRIVSAPSGSGAPTSPDRGRQLMLAFVIGFAIPFALIFLLDFLNTKVRGRLDLEKLSAPFLGEIPLDPNLKTSWFKRLFSKSKGKEKDYGKIVIAKGSRNMINEAFRVLRTNLDLVMAKSPTHNVICVTSFNPGSGKSFITVNLSVALAIREKRVLVIDGDLRHASLSKYVGEPKHGITDYLSGRNNDINSLLVQMPGYPTLDVLPVGKIPPNPTELLEDPRMHQLLETLRGQYAYIFIDCPPVDVVADTQIVERQCDRTIFVVRAGLLERAMIADIENIYRTKRLKNVTLVLNGTEAADIKYGYKYSYKYGYYGHGGSSYYSQD